MSGSSLLLRGRRVLVAGIMLAACLINSSATLTASQVATVLPAEQFTRSAGPPATIVRTFGVAPPVEGPFTLTIVSGEPDPRRPGAVIDAARATVVLNGVQIVGPGDFRTARIDKTIAVSSENVLEIRLLGAPGAHLTLGITGVVHVRISAITPDNGPVDTPVLITGSGFDPIASNNDVSFNGAAAVVLNATTTAIQTVVPTGATTGPITVTTPNGSASSTPFTVTSGNKLLISKSPEQPIYSRGQPITITALVVDRHGEPVSNAAVTLASTPSEDARVGDTFIYESDGTFTITATANPDGETLTASIALTVQGQGPVAACTQPVDGAMLDRAPGPLTLQGSVNSSNGISQFTVNGENVTVIDGAFTTTINAAWGLNVVSLMVVDNAGTAAQRTCAFVLSDTWAGEDQPAADTISLKLVQAAIDDATRMDGVDSLDDMLFAVINGSRARDTLHTALLSTNPLKPDSCDRSVALPFGGSMCVLSSEVTYSSSQLGGPNTTSLTLVNGGMASATRLANPVIRLRVRGDEALVPYDITGDVVFSFVDVQLTFNLGLANGRPIVAIRSGSVSTNVGQVQTNFPGLSPDVLDIIVALAQGQLRDAVRNTLRDYVTNNFTAVLDGVFGGLDVGALPITYQVASLSGGSPIAVSFGLNFSVVNASSSRALFGIGTRFQSPAAHARPSFGIPLRPGAAPLLDMTVTSPATIGAAFHEAIRGQTLHALWRGGYFDTLLPGGALNGTVPAGATLTTAAMLPPVTTIRGDGRTELAIGAWQIQLQNPALFPIPITGNLAGRVSCASRLEGDALVLEACTVDDMQFAAAQQLDTATAAQVESLLSGVLGALMPTAAGAALPSLPIPGFSMPSSLGVFGLPTGGVFGIVSPNSSNVAPHHVLRGGAGIR